MMDSRVDPVDPEDDKNPEMMWLNDEFGNSAWHFESPLTRFKRDKKEANEYFKGLPKDLLKTLTGKEKRCLWHWACFNGNIKHMARTMKCSRMNIHKTMERAFTKLNRGGNNVIS